ncbi:OTU domain-containing protein 5-B-like [Durio zibethinus]|uniref:ubiquitinyl hydrolase 1 n=1 Tax=Durio zibethinus TaxID=66656 RepID=A0A6P5ZTE3_DURZI|nr:OTU domain-containing protein 5-B-like [Durio zibethinus]XP_022756002.1 OTU domain-containing protein 5-B-like [Durio zibethinus]XP_022756003.1 OTU domain-containing protein 5-B-like [Durio zibethinus]XP_022756004.1 OTU domain-containing protein 5-B-like [Durio zibethinus]XP_022756005.1 OTU domain-containing protein 5-B-like [Durio zibethinus]XP_022756006.1 OTU domain-containing protein 5-B-like [Durio zibethinus]
MTRIWVQRGSTGSSSSNPTPSSSLPGPSSSRAELQVSNHQVPSAGKDEEVSEEVQEQVTSDELLECSRSSENKAVKSDDSLLENLHNDRNETSSEAIAKAEKVHSLDPLGPWDMMNDLGGLKISEKVLAETESSSCDPLPIGSGSPLPPPPPIPPPKPSATNSNSRRSVSGGSNTVRAGSSRRTVAWPIVSTRSSPSGSRPSSPRSHGESEGYNSADEQNPCFVSSYDDAERERQFEIDIRRAKGLEVKWMLEDGNCLFRAVADQVYGDSEDYDSVRQMCIEYMERERDHFSQFITEGFTSYCKRKRRDKVYGNNVEIQALSEMYNRPIHIYSYSIEPINIFHGSYNTDTPPIRLSYHHGNHYNSLVDPRRLTIGAGLGFSCLRGANVDKDQVKAAIKAQQDQQIDNALLAEGRFYSDLELTEKEIERMVMEASRAEYLANDKFKPQVGCKESSTSTAEPSSSGARPSGSETKVEGSKEHGLQDSVLSNGIQLLLSMGFTYLQAIEAYSIFGDDVDSMVYYLLETCSSSRRKGKATE